MSQKVRNGYIITLFTATTHTALLLQHTLRYCYNTHCVTAVIHTVLLLQTKMITDVFTGVLLKVLLLRTQ